jgi:GTP cyclohydrolase IA
LAPVADAAQAAAVPECQGTNVAKSKPRVGDQIPDLVESLLVELGEDPERQGLKQTPARVSKALRQLTDGYGVQPEDVIAGAVFDQDYDEMVVVKDITFYSLCEHHMLPFFGRCHVGYLPKGKVVGLSKIPRLVGVFAHRLQLQERLTNDIAEALNSTLLPKGVGVVVEARHLCMEMRGVEKPGGQMITSCMLGTFRRDPRTRAEFLNLVRHP